MMLRRRMPKARPGARESPARKPSSSGPRWRMASAMARTRDPASVFGESNATPQMPHTLLLDLRGRKERHSRAHSFLTQANSREFQPLVGIPGEPGTPEEEKKRREQGGAQEEQRFALEKQAPVGGCIPSRVDGVQEFSKTEAMGNETGQPDVGHRLEGVFRWIAFDTIDGLRKGGRVLEIRARKHAAFRVDVHGGAFRREQEEPASLQTGTSGEIQESVRGRAANIQKLLIVERSFRIAAGKVRRIGGNGARRAHPHPVQNVLDLLFGSGGRGDNRIGKTLQIPANGKFPAKAIERDEHGRDAKQIADPPDELEELMLAPAQEVTPSASIFHLWASKWQALCIKIACPERVAANPA